jgi:hypothetical protein
MMEFKTQTFYSKYFIVNSILNVIVSLYYKCRYYRHTLHIIILSTTFYLTPAVTVNYSFVKYLTNGIICTLIIHNICWIL